MYATKIERTDLPPTWYINRFVVPQIPCFEETYFGGTDKCLQL